MGCVEGEDDEDEDEEGKGVEGGFEPDGGAEERPNPGKRWILGEGERTTGGVVGVGDRGRHHGAIGLWKRR